MEKKLKEQLIEQLSAISDEDFIKAVERWIGFDLKGEGMVENFISILKEYTD